MPRDSQQLAATVLSQPRALIASASRMSGTTSSKAKPKARKNVGAEWQRRAWAWFDEIGEYRYAVQWVGNLLSKATLGVVGPDGRPVTSGPAFEAMQLLFNGPDGQAEMLRQFGIQLTVAGEGYIVGEDGGEYGEDSWYVAAATEISQRGGQWKVSKEVIPGTPLVIRLWRPHPREHMEPDAPSRPILPILAEIDGLTKHVAAQIDSRLAGAGILLLPSEMSFAAMGKEGPDGQTQDGTLQSFLQELMDAMITPIEDRSDASALVPLLLQAPGEWLDKIQHLTMWSDLDKQAIELRAEAIGRLALGMDMPPEALTGTAGMNHWGAWQMEEAAIKSHTEPLLQIITSSLTTGYLRPYLIDEEVENVRGYKIVADTSKMRLRPNRSKEAIELYDRGELSAEALLRENGFEPGDAMEDAERIKWLTKKVASGSTTPELVSAALASLGVHVPVEVLQVADAARTQEERPTPSLTEHPNRSMPETSNNVVAAEMAVHRALERAGNRLKSKHGVKVDGVEACDLYLHANRDFSGAEIDDLLADAWSSLSRFDLNISEGTLDTYARMLIKGRRAHSTQSLSGFLHAVGSLDKS